MSLDFLTPVAQSDAVVARSPMERAARAAGARFERRDGWNVAVDFGDLEGERARIAQTVAFLDRSPLTKREIHGDPGVSLSPGMATRSDEAWWCPVTPSRTLVLAEDSASIPDADGVDLTCGLAALSLIGPGCRDLLARFCALDVRPAVAPVGSFRPGSVARTPGYLLVEAQERLLIMVGWALGEYLWSVVADAAERLGGGPVGVAAVMELAHARA